MSRLPKRVKSMDHMDVESCFRMWTKCRPFPGVKLGQKTHEESIDTTSLDVVIVLLRALRAYGWLCRPKTKIEEAFEKLVDLNLGWDEDQDQSAKGMLVESLFKDANKAAVESFRLLDVIDGHFPGLIAENESFQLFDIKILWQSSIGTKWESTPLGGPYDTRSECQWTGATSLQDHMDKLFMAQNHPNDEGTGHYRCIHLGRPVEFIHLRYKPTQIRTFEEISKFDLHTVVRDTGNDGEKALKQQDVRYHILAVVKLSPKGCEDIRVYDDVGRNIEEVVPPTLEDKTRKRKQIPYWSVETMNGSVFELFYYQLLEQVDWLVNRSTIQYDPVEFRSANNDEE